MMWRKRENEGGCALRGAAPALYSFSFGKSPSRTVTSLIHALVIGILGGIPLLAGQERNERPLTKGQAKSTTQRTVQQGVAVEFSVEPVAGNKPLDELREGDPVVFRFKMADLGTGSPLTNADPAAWVSSRPEGKTTDAPACTAKVKEFLSGNIFSQAELDLNVYYVLALNGDPTVTVVDPLFGFGSTKLLALVSLKSPGEDWVLTPDESRLFVSMPDSNQVAVIETASWKVIANLDVRPSPTRLLLQPDGHYLWISHGGVDSGVTALTVNTLQTAARVPTGNGPHQIAISDDNTLAFVTNGDDGNVSIIDVRTLRKIKDLKTGRRPTSVAFSSLSRMAYVTDGIDGTISVIDAREKEIVARVKAEAGLGQIKFAPGGRLGFVVNPAKNLIHILDAASNRVVQTGGLEDGPDQLAFSNKLAYVRHRGSENVLMIPLKEVGVEGRPVPVVDFPGGQNPPGKGTKPSPADGIVQAPGENAVLVANPADRAIYFYKEGMAAPMGSFSNYSREPRAVLVVDRSLRERSPGVYETTARLPRAGLYDVAFFLNTPRVVHCFEVAVTPSPELEATRRNGLADIEPLTSNRVVTVGERVRVAFRLSDSATGKPHSNLNDVRVLTFLAPGIWHKRHPAIPRGDGVYDIDFVPPQPGVYYVYLECPSLGLALNNERYVILHAKERGTTE